jgi:hypothetical protein
MEVYLRGLVPLAGLEPAGLCPQLAVTSRIQAEEIDSRPTEVPPGGVVPGPRGLNEAP